jgi:hypothetical protein
MRFLFRWIIRFFGIFVFARGAWMLWTRWHLDHTDLTHRSIEGEIHYLGNSLHDNYYVIEQFTLSSAFLLTVSGLIILMLSFRR